jgi:hypothetical protein
MQHWPVELQLSQLWAITSALPMSSARNAIAAQRIILLKTRPYLHDFLLSPAMRHAALANIASSAKIPQEVIANSYHRVG